MQTAQHPGRIAVLCGLFAACGSPMSAQTLEHLYQFNGNYADTLGGSALTANGATPGAGSLSFAANQGPTFDGVAALAGNYSIGLRFSLDTLSGWDKLVDFKGLASDNGSYTYGNHLQFVYDAPVDFKNGSTPLTTNTLMDVVFTRDAATNVFSAYLNGSAAPEYSFTDASGQGVAQLVDGKARFSFFVDDHNTGQGEASAGQVREIRIWDAPLASSQISTAFTAIPEPADYGLLLGAATALAAVVWRRRR